MTLKIQNVFKYNYELCFGCVNGQRLRNSGLEGGDNCTYKKNGYFIQTRLNGSMLTGQNVLYYI